MTDKEAIIELYNLLNQLTDGLKLILEQQIKAESNRIDILTGISKLHNENHLATFNEIKERLNALEQTKID